MASWFWPSVASGVLGVVLFAAYRFYRRCQQQDALHAEHLRQVREEAAQAEIQRQARAVELARARGATEAAEGRLTLVQGGGSGSGVLTPDALKARER